MIGRGAISYANNTLPPLQCNGCTACCKMDTVVLMPGDDPSQYETRDIGGGRLALAIKPGTQKGTAGECVYLVEAGCSIHDRTRPHLCRVFDCRVFYLKRSRSERRAEIRRDPESKPVFDEARKRLEGV